MPKRISARVAVGAGLVVATLVGGAGASAAPASAVGTTDIGGIALTVSKPTLPPGATEVFKGRLASHKRGVEIDLALKSGKQWLDVLSTKTYRGGRYHLTRTAPSKTGRYVFKAHDLVGRYKVTAESAPVTITVG